MTREVKQCWEGVGSALSGGGEEAVDGEWDRNSNSGSDWRWIVSCGGHRGRDCGGKGRSFEGE